MDANANRPFVMTCDEVKTPVEDTEAVHPNTQEARGDDAGEGEPTPTADEYGKMPPPEPPARKHGDKLVRIRRTFKVVPEKVKEAKNDEKVDSIAKDEADVFYCKNITMCKRNGKPFCGKGDKCFTKNGVSHGFEDFAMDEAVAMDAKKVATSFADCKAKNPMRCPYHGAAAMSDAFGKILAKHGLGDMKFSIEPVPLTDDDTTYHLEFDCPAELADTVGHDVLKEFGKLPAIDLDPDDDESGAISEKSKTGWVSDFQTDFFDKECAEPSVDACPPDVEKAAIEEATGEKTIGDPDEDVKKDEPPKKDANQPSETEQPKDEGGEKTNEQPPQKKNEKKPDDDGPYALPEWLEKYGENLLKDYDLPNTKENMDALEKIHEKLLNDGDIYYDGTNFLYKNNKQGMAKYDAAMKELAASQQSKTSESKKPITPEEAEPAPLDKDEGLKSSEKAKNKTAELQQEFGTLESPTPKHIQKMAELETLADQIAAAEDFLSETEGIAKKMEDAAAKNPLMAPLAQMAKTNLTNAKTALGDAQVKFSDAVNDVKDMNAAAKKEAAKKAIAYGKEQLGEMIEMFANYLEKNGHNGEESADEFISKEALKVTANATTVDSDAMEAAAAESGFEAAKNRAVNAFKGVEDAVQHWNDAVKKGKTTMDKKTAGSHMDSINSAFVTLMSSCAKVIAKTQVAKEAYEAAVKAKKDAAAKAQKAAAAKAAPKSKKEQTAAMIEKMKKQLESMGNDFNKTVMEKKLKFFQQMYDKMA